MNETESKEQVPTRNNYFYFSSLPTRWIDNDLYGHVNNAVYYQYFDTVANEYLIDNGGLDISADVVAFIVASSCEYFAPISHPAVLDVGFRVNRLGRSSVEYGLAIFISDSDEIAASGTFTHAFVSRAQGRSVPIPDKIRKALEAAQLN